MIAPNLWPGIAVRPAHHHAAGRIPGVPGPPGVLGPRGHAAIVRGNFIVAGLLAAPMALISIEGFYSLAPLLLILGTLEPVLLPVKEHGVRHFAFAVLGWGYIAWFLAHMTLIDKYIPGGIGSASGAGVGCGVERCRRIYRGQEVRTSQNGSNAEPKQDLGRVNREFHRGLRRSRSHEFRYPPGIAVGRGDIVSGSDCSRIDTGATCWNRASSASLR